MPFAGITIESRICIGWDRASTYLATTWIIKDTRPQQTWGGKENARPADLDMPLEEEEVDEEGDKEFTSLEGAFGLEGSGQQKSIHETQAPAKKSCDKSMSIDSLCV